MRAFQLKDYSGPAGLELVDAAEPEPTSDELLIDVRAIGVNFPDLLMTKGEYQYRPELPVIPGCEVAGDVVSAPAGSGFTPGDRVAAFAWNGGYAERAAVPIRSVISIPASMDHTAAAAMVVNYNTAYFALGRRGNVRPGQTVLVLGAGGGIGTAAVQVARGMGARVIAGVADERQRAVAEAAGAPHVLVLQKGFSRAIREITDGRGVDAVVDPLGDWLFDEAVRALGPEGRILVIGFAAGEIPQIKVNRLLLRNASVVGVAFGAFLDVEPELMGDQAAELAKMVEAGAVVPQVGMTFPFAELPGALSRLERSQIPGKGVVVL